jgi:hypothetical protein
VIKLLVALFIFGTLVLLMRIISWSLEGVVIMPFMCPRCGSAGDTDIADQPEPWYVELSAERVQCRNCHTYFKEHPNGLLVEDRDS